jgi:protein transport protein SEC24
LTQQPTGFRPTQPPHRPSNLLPRDTNAVVARPSSASPIGFRPSRPSGPVASIPVSNAPYRPNFVPNTSIQQQRPLQNGAGNPSPVPVPNQSMQPPLNEQASKTRRVYPGMAPTQSTIPNVLQHNQQSFQSSFPLPANPQHVNAPALQPGVPQNPYPPQQPQMSQPGYTPQMGQFSPYVPQPGLSTNTYPNQQNQPGFVPQQANYAPQIGQPDGNMPQSGYIPDLQAGYQNMTLNAPTQPNGVNVMAGPPPIDAFDTPVLGANIISQSVSQSPHSNSPAVYKQCTLNAIPQTAALLDKTKLPFGMILSPYRQLLKQDVMHIDIDYCSNHSFHTNCSLQEM